MDSSNGHGAAFDAVVSTGPPRTTPADYHDQLADAAEEAASNVERTIADLKESRARTGNEG
jgi:hypothetical protein